MEPIQKRTELLQYLSTADDEKVQALYTVLESDINAMYTVPEEQLQMILEAREQDLKGETPSYPWEEVLERLKTRISKHAA
jgi:hypothetical protein